MIAGLYLSHLQSELFLTWWYSTGRGCSSACWSNSCQQWQIYEVAFHRSSCWCRGGSGQPCRWAAAGKDWQPQGWSLCTSVQKKRGWTKLCFFQVTQVLMFWTHTAGSWCVKEDKYWVTTNPTDIIFSSTCYTWKIPPRTVKRQFLGPNQSKAKCNKKLTNSSKTHLKTEQPWTGQHFMFHV